MELIYLDTEKVKVRPNRQRAKIEPETLKELAQSILNIGLLNPIVVEPEPNTDNFYLIAGERRLTAFKSLIQSGELTKEARIKATVYANLDDRGRQLIELEENIKREDLPWIDRVKAIARIVSFFPDETQESLAQRLGFSASQLARSMIVYENLEKPQVQAASGLTNAYNICVKETQRQMDNVLADIGASLKFEAAPATSAEVPKVEVVETSTPLEAPKTPDPVADSPYRIHQADFFEWLKDYRGPSFNLLHLDFPYGIRHDKSQAGNTAHYGTYEDTEDLYKSLCEALFLNEALLAPTCHVICWLSLNYEAWTKELFAKHGFDCHLQPLIWHKTDNKGIIGDTTCGLRNVGEYALLFNRGRRPLRQAVANIVDSPTIKSFHASEKPLGVLNHFFKALCDSSSRVLDPTCGSGTSIRAAANAKAEFAIGLELDTSFAEKAQEALAAHLLTTNLEVSF